MSTPILASWSWEKTLLQLVRSRVKFDNICVALSACLLSLSCINWKNKIIILILLIKRVPLFRCIPTNVLVQLQRYTSKKLHALKYNPTHNFFRQLTNPRPHTGWLYVQHLWFQVLPDQLKDDTFANCLKDDKSTKHWLSQLLKNVETMSTAGAAAGASSGTAASLKNQAQAKMTKEWGWA